MRSDPSLEPLPEARWQAAVAVVVVANDKALALKRGARADFAPGVWEAVAGRVENGESLLEAAERELIEEAGPGLAASAEIHPRPVDAYTFQRGSVGTVLVVYRADIDPSQTDTVEVRLSSAHDAFAWWTIDAFRAAGTPPRLVEAIQCALGCDSSNETSE